MARVKKVAAVLCKGGNRAKRKSDASYANCQEALEKCPEGVLECSAGCLGFGSCVAACKLKAIHIGPHGAAEVDRNKCVGCGLCAKACPQGLIIIEPEDFYISARCSTKVPAPQVRNVCQAGCISCRMCERNCPTGAIVIKDGHAVIDYDKCVSCGMCAAKCPRGVIVDARGVFTEA